MFEVISEDLQCSPPWGWQGRVRMDEGKSSRKVAEWYAVCPADSTFSVAESTESKWDGSGWQNPESVLFLLAW